MTNPTLDVQPFDQASRRLVWSVLVYLGFVGVVALANVLASMAGGNEESPLMMAAGVLFGFIAIPVLCVAIPLWLARRWGLPRSWWPPKDHLGISLAVVALFVFLGNYTAIEGLVTSDFDWARFAVHFISSMLFHVPYYPLFAILIFTTARAWKGTGFAILMTATLFSLYHLAQFHFFPAGTKPFFLLLLFAAFSWHLLLYLFTRSIFMVAFVHSVGGAVAMAAKGTYHDGVDFLFFLTILIVVGVIVYGLFDQRRMSRDDLLKKMSWPSVMAAAQGEPDSVEEVH